MTHIESKAAMSSAYDPSAVENRVYEFWMEGGYFKPRVDETREPFSIIMPPPNVTGELHMGHALTTALEDMMVRWHRMRGDPTLYLPGTDHAGIATQVVVERMLAKDGLTRHDIGRDEFVAIVWKWVDQYGGRIYEQIKRLGASCDWTRRSFTLDDGPSKAVRSTFVNLYRKGMIYQGERIVNWCPRCATALSDLEVRHRDEDASLYSIRYQFENNDGGLVVATTRPETLLGDTAIAINPADSRYSDLVGNKVSLPLIGRLIPIISDTSVDPDFGTGVLKVTPGHDHSDFEIGARHGLTILTVMNLDGTMNPNASHYNGMDRFKVRGLITEELEQAGLLEGVEPYRHSVGHCDRCDEVVEPLVSKQWYMRMEDLARPAIEAVERKRITIVPERFSKVYYNWMHNIRDWCISRQLWWGHRIPVWYCQACSHLVVELDDPELCGECGSNNLEQDPDVLDTWFSSALWPQSTLGWPNQTEDFKYFYPTSVMETGHDILFFWVARMLMMGIENTGEIPFRSIYLHGMVLDPAGVKMSKVKGNVLDPIELIGMYGADAVRFALTTGNSPGNDMRVNESKLEASRNFANKLWNAARFVMSNTKDTSDIDTWSWPPHPEHIEDRWIFSRFNSTVDSIDKYMGEFQFGEAQRCAHDFVWGEFCDWYLEMSKIRIRSGDDAPIQILVYILESILRLLHPFLPFITEEIWQKLVALVPYFGRTSPALMVSDYPTVESSKLDSEADASIDAVIDIVRAFRNFRAEFRIRPNEILDAFIDAPELSSVVKSELDVIESFSKIRIREDKIGLNPKDLIPLVLSRGTLVVHLGGVLDLEREKARLYKELEDIKNNRNRLKSRISDVEFLSKAPKDVIEKERNRMADLDQRYQRLGDILAKLVV